MTQTNQSRNRITDTDHRLTVAKGEWGQEKNELGVWDIVDANYYIKMDKQGPTVYHRKLYSISHDKP